MHSTPLFSIFVTLLLAGCTMDHEAVRRESIYVKEDIHHDGAVNFTDLKDSAPRTELLQILENASRSSFKQKITKVNSAPEVLELFEQVNATMPYRVWWNNTCYQVHAVYAAH